MKLESVVGQITPSFSISSTPERRLSMIDWIRVESEVLRPLRISMVSEPYFTLLEFGKEFGP